MASVNWGALAAMVALLVPLSFYDYLLFHTLAELFSIIVAMSAFVVAWRAYPFTRNDFLMFLGIGLFWVGALDLMHTLLYKGMGLFPGADANHPTQVWIATRYLQAVALLAAPAFLARRLDRLPAFVGFGVVATVLFFAVMGGYFPDAFIEGEGLTIFKVASEYVIIGLLAAAIVFLWSRRPLLDERVLLLVAGSIGTTMAAELAFTFYVDVYGLSNLVGHLLKLVAYWLLYSALVVFTLTQPFRAMARAASTYDAIPESIAVIDLDGFVRQANRSAARTVGLAPQDCIGRHCHELFHSRDKSPDDCPVCRSIERGSAVENLVLESRPDRRWHEFTLTPIALTDAPAGMVHVRRDVTERRLGERQSRLLAAIVDSTDDAVIGKGLDGIILSWNAGAQRIYGYSAEEAIGKPASLLLSSDRPDESIEILQRIQRGEQVVHYETTRRRKDGSRIHISLTVSPIRDDTGAISGASVIARDITERKAAEEALRRSAAEIEDLYNNAPCGYHSLDGDGRFVRINDTELAWLGYTRDEVVGRLRVADLLTPSSLAVFNEKFSQFKEQGELRDLELEFVRKDGSILPVALNATAVRDSAGCYLMSRSTVHDITERRRATTLLRQSEERFRGLVETSSDWIWEVTLDGGSTYSYASPRITDILGYSPDELIGRSPFDLMPPEEAERVREIFSGIVRERRPIESLENVNLHKDGRRVVLETTGIPYFDDKGTLIGYRGMDRDITRRKRNIEELRKRAHDLAERAKEANCMHTVMQLAQRHDLALPELFRHTCEALREAHQYPDVTCVELRFGPEAVRTGNFAEAAWRQTAPITVDGNEEGRITVGQIEARSEGAHDPFLAEEVALLQTVARRIGDTIADRRRRQALADSERKFRTLAEISPIGIYRTDSQGQLIFVNPRWCEITRITTEEALAQRWTYGLHPEDLERAEAEWRRATRTRTRFRSEHRFQRRDGTTIWVLARAVAEYGQDGEVTGHVGTITDITERKLAEVELLRLNRTLRTISACNEALVRAASEQQLLDEMCRIIVETGGYRMAWVGYAEHDADRTVRPVGMHGQESGYLRTAKITWGEAERGEGPTGRAIRTGEVQIVEDTHLDPRFAPWRADAERRGYRSTAALPLTTSAGAAFGALSIYAAEPHTFTEEAIRLLQELATDLAYGIEALRTREQHRRAEADLRESEERYRSLVEAMAEGILVTDPNGVVIACNRSTERILGLPADRILGRKTPGQDHALIHEDGSPFADHELPPAVAQRTGRPQIDVTIGVRKPGGVVTWTTGTSIPLFQPGQTIPYRVISTFHDTTERRAQSEKIRRLTRIHEVLSGINSTIVRARNRQELFDEACRIAVEHGRFGIAWIGEFDPATMNVSPVAWAGIDSETVVRSRGITRDDVVRGEGVVARVIRDRKPAFDNDIAAMPEVGGERRREALRCGYRSLVTLPLTVGNALAGVLVLYAKESNYFDADELKLLQELAADISFALDHMAQEEKVAYLAYHDVLTGLPNRALFAERLDQQLQQAQRGNRKTALALLDVERFRNVNDTLGRHAGDALLKTVAQRLAQGLEDRVGVARLEADRFALTLGEIADAADAAHFIEQKLDACFRDPFQIGAEELRISVRLGIALFPADGSDADTLYRNAEAALTKAKSQAEHYLFYAPEMNASVAESLDLENRLRKAVAEQQFVMHYQPKVDSRTGAVVGLEALIRWNDPRQGLVPPVKFIPILESTGMILPAGEWAMRQVVSDHMRWVEKGLRPPRVAVNVSAIQLRQKGFVETVRSAIGAAANGAHGLDLEITESLIVEYAAETIEKLKTLKQMGVQIAIDDFGTGYSSLSHISRLPVDFLKIDRSFIIGMLHGANELAIVQTVITLAHNLGLKVVAEGVDAEEQAHLLRLLRCDEMQGYLFAKPMPADNIEALLGANVDAGT